MGQADKKIKNDGPGCLENVVGWATLRPSIQKFDWPGRAAAYLLKK